MATETQPLWQLIEQQLLDLGSADLDAGSREKTIQRVAKVLDETGANVSLDGGNMLLLRRAVETRAKAGRPLWKDITDATAALTFDDVVNPHAATLKIVRNLGSTFPAVKESERIADIRKMVDRTKLDLFVSKAKGLPDDQGIRLLITEDVEPEVLIARLGITQEKLDEVNAAIAAEQAEVARVEGLLEKVADQPDDARIKHLIDNEVSDELIIQLAKVDQSALDGVKRSMEAELAEKKRLAEEEAARKKAEADGPPLEDIPADEMLEHIESIREILEFSEVEAEIRQMCEQSSLPKALVDIAVSEPDKLDELESKAGG